MGQIKGQTGNWEGRPKGATNKTTKATKELLEQFINKNFLEAVSAWSDLEPVDKVKTYFSLLRYVVPTLTSVKVNDTNDLNIVRKILENQK